MKKILTLFVMGLMLVSCDKENMTSYVIDGNAEGVLNGIRVRLAIIDPTGKQVIRDSAIVMNEKFSLKGGVEEPNIHFLSLDGSPGNVIFMLENSAIAINFNKDLPMESKVTGSASNEGYEALKKGMIQFKDEGGAIMAIYNELGSLPESETRDSIGKAMANLRERQSAFPLSFVKKHNDSYFSLNLIELESSRPNFEILGFKDAFENFTPKLKASKKGIVVKQRLDKLHEAYQQIAHLEVGKVAPNFEAPTPNGDMVSLDQLKGKVTIIDFWAAWCGPCRKENPNVVKVYEKFHDQGLEIVGVSLDGQSRQKDPKKAWLAAIKKDKLTWTQVSNLNYFNDPVAQLYNIRSIPATFILDKDGKIAYKNLRGRALEVKVEELLKQ